MKYTNKDIIKAISDNKEELIKAITKVHDQTIKTNGRVNFNRAWLYGVSLLLLFTLGLIKFT